MNLISLLSKTGKRHFSKRDIEKSLIYLEKSSNKFTMSKEEISEKTFSTYQLILKTYPLSEELSMKDLNNLINYLDRLKTIEKRYKVKN